MEQQKYTSVEEEESLFSLEQPSSKAKVEFSMQNLQLSANVCEPVVKYSCSPALDVLGYNLLLLQGILSDCFKGVSGLNWKHPFLMAAAFCIPFSFLYFFVYTI